jgi:ABC-type anion transport system duplicated permease subunit
MRKRHRVLIFVALVAALVVPVGYALSVESPAPARVNAGYATVVPAHAMSEIPAASIVAAPVTISLNGAASATPSSVLPVASDSVKLFGIGTLLLGLAAFVRRA